MKCDQWRASLEERGGGLPFDQWPADDPFRQLAHTYGLTPKDLARLLDRLGTSCEARAERSGYAEHWDPLPPHEASPNSPRPRRQAA